VRQPANAIQSAVKSFPSQLPHRTALISDSPAFSQTPAKAAGHGASVSHSVPVYSPSLRRCKVCSH